ncbi:hypothetical protein WH47_11017 [Habropoda laboriosa]|uniref:CCHC-type domain-containing protein n=1 Tax=Habropoda laboriosa TaxID=597456 RepID=A0A0L7QM59_9HYME|nr:hypothetical protein WH47_11017 [Habropoda laboriosa]
MGSRNRRLQIQGVDGVTTKEEILEVMRIVTSEGDINVVYLREGFGGTQTACVEMSERGVEQCVECKKIKIGWNRCRVREVKANNECYRCGGAGHYATNCNIKNKRCCKCGSEVHLVKDCQEIGNARARTETGGVAKVIAERQEGVISRTKNVEKRIIEVDEVREVTRMRTRTIGTQTEETRIRREEARENTEEWKKALGRKETWTEVVRKASPPKKVQKEGNGNVVPKEKRTTEKSVDVARRGRTRGLAVVVRNENENFEEALRTIRGKISAVDMEGIKSVRTRAGEILFECEEEEEARKWRKRIEGMEGIRNVRRLGPRDAVKIRGIDVLANNEMIIEAIENSITMTTE